MNGLALCAGVGGLELGLKLALGEQHRTVCYVEREAYTAACLVVRMEDQALDPAPVWDDLSTFDGKRWRGVVDIVTAGFPCQPHSVAGRRKGAQDERNLWPDVCRIIAECDPALVFLENVPGALRFFWEHVLPDLRGLGYGVEAGLFSAEEVGAPQRRERLFVLAYTNGEPRHAEQGLESEGDEDGAVCAGHVDGCSGEAVANTSSTRLQRRQSERGNTREECSTIERIGDPVGYATSNNVTDVRLHEGQRESPSGGPSGELALWPPGPDCSPKDWPEDVPQPCIRRGADGSASRMDRLSALGNAVVPLVAAHAFRTLIGRLR